MLAGKHILVVEDEPLIALDIADLLERAGATVVGPAFSLTEAMTLAQNCRVDGALLDIDLGREQVWPLAETLARDGKPFTFVTARCERPDKPATLGPCNCISKPVSSDLILQAAARF